MGLHLEILLSSSKPVGVAAATIGLPPPVNKHEFHASCFAGHETLAVSSGFSFFVRQFVVRV